MKKSILFFAASLLFAMTSCNGQIVRSAAQKLNLDITTSTNPDTTIIASDNFVTITKDIKQFSKLINNIAADFTYIQNEEAPKITITGPDNIIELVIIKEKDSILTLSFPERLRINRQEDLKVSINSKEINLITQNGVGDFLAENLHSNKMRIINNGVGDLKIHKVATRELIIKNNGVGDTKITNIETNNLDADNHGVGDITITGNADFADVKNHGVGDIKIGDLKAKELKKKNNGVGSIK